MCVISLLSFKPGFKVIFTWFEHARIACPLGLMLTSLHFSLYLDSWSVSVIHLCYQNSLPHIFTTVLPKNLLSITNLWTLVLIHLGLSCLDFTDLVFFFSPQELNDISYPQTTRRLQSTKNEFNSRKNEYESMAVIASAEEIAEANKREQYLL